MVVCLFAGGFAGRRGCWSCVFLVYCDLPALMDLLGPCTNVFLTAYAHVRTEPQCDIGQTRGKKKITARSSRGFGPRGGTPQAEVPQTRFQ